MASIFAPNPAKLALVAGSLGFSIFFITQYLKFNRGGWRKVHYRGMLFFEALAAYEERAAMLEKRQPQLPKAYMNLAEVLCVDFSTKVRANQVMERWVQKKETSLNDLFVKHGPEVFKDKSLMMNRTLSKQQPLANDVIAGVIHEIYGPKEVLVYYKACVDRKAA